ncbi:putative gustatory receptor 28a isoform X2 [Armigeres subalbatus]|uniref:putative gustatory receptor 28a isoform X2 n=1 Tax=Armigeres subalbatus TaxID=124917 RepID=UPI002ED4A3F3
MPFMMISMIIILFVSLLNQCKYRFSLLNEILSSLREKIIEKNLARDNVYSVTEEVRIKKPRRISAVFPAGSSSWYAQVLNRVASIQSEICDACDSLEHYFTVQMLSMIAISFLISVFDVYYIVEKMFADGSANSHVSKLQFVAFFFSQGLVHVVGVMKVVYFAALAVNENKQIAVNVHKLINVNHYDEELTKQLTNLSLQLNHRKVAFTAYGFFKLDFTLLFTLVGAATTYLVILVQFSLNQSQPCDPKMISAITAHRNATKSP